MIKAESFITKAKEEGFGLYTGVPCSYLKPFINYVIDSDDVRYVAAANEGDAVAIAAGAQLGGQRSVVMFQNSGFGNTVNPLTSLTYTFKVPVLVIVTLRGEPGGPADEPQHELMGQITTGLLDLMQIPWEYFPTEESEVSDAIARAVDCMDIYRQPYAFVMKKGSVDLCPLKSKPQQQVPTAAVHSDLAQAPIASRREVLELIQKNAAAEDLLLATTGYNGRELYACDDRENQLYMVGSMGCISSLGLGVALAQPQRRVFAIDGDGAFLMRMGALSAIGYEKPKNLVHILLDNNIHESTGGQSTVAHSIDFCAIAAANGYPVVEFAKSLEEVEAFLSSPQGQLSFLHVRTSQGVSDGLPRPSITPADVALRLQKFMGTNS